MAGRTPIREIKGNSNINIKLKDAPEVFRILGIDPKTSYLMDAKRAIWGLYGLGEPEITVRRAQKTLSEQRPNNAYGVKITRAEIQRFMELFGLTENDPFQESIGQRIVSDILTGKLTPT